LNVQSVITGRNDVYQLNLLVYIRWHI